MSSSHSVLLGNCSSMGARIDPDFGDLRIWCGPTTVSFLAPAMAPANDKFLRMLRDTIDRYFKEKEDADL